MSSSQKCNRLSSGSVASLSLLGLLLVLAGCEGVQEDRTIEFSAQGESVGFQHGDQGLFVADKDGKGLTKVFQPGADVLATSTPLWSPQGRRLIFTTARAAEGDAAVAAQSHAQLRSLMAGGSEPNPAGDVFTQMPVVYTCWLRDEEAGEAPVKLFDAKCDHVGYVAANLAVRWHPRGDQIVYVNATATGSHALFAFDMKTKASRKIFPHEASAVVFDWSPDGQHLACVLGTPRERAAASTEGLWIGRPDSDKPDWWHVPGSEKFAHTELGSLLEQLRATRPAWTADSQSFAFVTNHRNTPGNDPGESRLWVGRLNGRGVEEIARKPDRIRDLHWSPTGELLGFVCGSAEPGQLATVVPEAGARAMTTLHTWTRAGGLSGPLNQRSVRRFAGWCAAGDHLAYVVPGEVLGMSRPLWSFLLVPNALARDAVLIGDSAVVAQSTAKEAFSGLRVTFPHWSTSSSDDLLSLWCTFTPSHQSALARFLGGGLRSCDPAAVLDARTGTLSWMAVSPIEEAQVGHYEQIKGAYAEAWQRYQRADAALRSAAVTPDPEPKSAMEWATRLFSPRGIAVFEFHCLKKLGRHEEALAKLESFRKAYPPPLPAAGSQNSAPGSPPAQFPADQLWFRDLLKSGGLCARLLQDLYIAEVLLSIDASEDASGYFHAIIVAGPAESEIVRISAAVVLSQVLLLEARYDEYATLCTETLAPLLLDRHRAHPAAPANIPFDGARIVPDMVSALALLPLTSKTFLSGLATNDVNALAAQWEALRGRASEDYDRLAADLVLEASYRRLGKSDKSREAVERIVRNPASNAAGAQGAGSVKGGITDEMIDGLRAIVSGNTTRPPSQGPR